MAYQPLEKVLNYLSTIRRDKLLHALVGMIIFSLFNLVIPHVYSLLIVVIVALSKEIYDNMNPKIHTASYWDFMFGVAIPLVVTLLWVVKEWI